MLLDIARGRGPFVLPEARTEAIRLLENRKELFVSEGLARLLQPHEQLHIRLQVAGSLKELPCDIECIRSILHYIERLDCGEVPEEDAIGLPHVERLLAPSLAKDKQELSENLILVIQKNEVATVANLQETYGLGSDNPSAFAVNLVSKISLQHSCPSLKQSLQYLADASEGGKIKKRIALQKASDFQKCQ